MAHLVTAPSAIGFAHKSKRSRVRIFDAVRGFSVISMVAFHLCYDLRFISGIPLAWFAPPFQHIWRASISWNFVFIAGCMCAFSRNNLKRAGVYLAAAALIFVATTVAAVDDAINFGIIFCMGACTLIEWVLEQAHIAPKGNATAVVLAVCFVLLLGVPRGYIGVGSLTAALPAAWYSTPWLSWLGLPGPHFVSGDYYPVLPYLLLYLCGTVWCRNRKSTKGFPERLYQPCCKPLEFVGRHSLLVYLLHQPVLLMLTGNL